MLQTYTYSGNDYTNAAAGTTTFALTSTEGNAIPYLQRAHIHVYLSDDEGDTWTEQARPAAWDFNAEGTSVVLEEGIEDGEWVRVLRITPILNRFVDFADGSLLTSAQLDQGEDYSRYCDQELSDSLANGLSGALRYMGQIDLTADSAPLNPQPGDVYINTGDGTTIQGGDPGWAGIVGDEVSGGEQVVYQADGTWTILQTPVSQVGVLSVTGTAPIVVNNDDDQNPVITFSDAPDDGTQYVRQATGDPAALTWAAVDIPPGTIIAAELPEGPHEAGQLGYNTTDGRLYIWVLNDDDPPVGAWVDASPAADPGVTKITAGNGIELDPEGGTGSVEISVPDLMPKGGGDDEIFYENGQTVTTDYTIPDNTNAGTFGEVTIADDVTVTVPNSGSWTVVGGGDGVLWKRDGTTLEPQNAGDNLQTSGSITSQPSTGKGKYVLIGEANSAGALKFFNDSGKKKLEIDYEGSIAAEGSVSIGGTDAAHTMDEYEEGSWTPNMGGNTTYRFQTGTYVKIGKLVTITGYLGILKIGSGSGIQINGLPFPVVKGEETGGGAVAYWFDTATNNSFVSLYTIDERDYLTIYGTDGSSNKLEGISPITDGAYLQFVVSYMT